MTPQCNMNLRGRIFCAPRLASRPPLAFCAALLALLLAALPLPAQD